MLYQLSYTRERSASLVPSLPNIPPRVVGVGFEPT